MPQLVHSWQELERELADMEAQSQSATTSIPLNTKTIVSAYFILFPRLVWDHYLRNTLEVKVSYH